MRRVKGQGALEYILLLAVFSAVVVFGSPLLMSRIRDAAGTGLSNAVQAMLTP